MYEREEKKMYEYVNVKSLDPRNNLRKEKKRKTFQFKETVTFLWNRLNRLSANTLFNIWK